MKKVKIIYELPAKEQLSVKFFLSWHNGFWFLSSKITVKDKDFLFSELITNKCAEEHAQHFSINLPENPTEQITFEIELKQS
jgi:hypothetical protein